MFVIDVNYDSIDDDSVLILMLLLITDYIKDVVNDIINDGLDSKMYIYI